ncbi:MAG: hypothetical protein ACYDDF_13690 [Thermoplasmatota archaeon]
MAARMLVLGLLVLSTVMLTPMASAQCDNTNYGIQFNYNSNNNGSCSNYYYTQNCDQTTGAGAAGGAGSAGPGENGVSASGTAGTSCNGGKGCSTDALKVACLPLAASNDNLPPPVGLGCSGVTDTQCYNGANPCTVYVNAAGDENCIWANSFCTQTDCTIIP